MNLPLKDAEGNAVGHAEELNAIYGALVPRGANASTVVQIPPTAKEALVEIQMIADGPKR